MIIMRNIGWFLLCVLSQTDAATCDSLQAKQAAEQACKADNNCDKCNHNNFGVCSLNKKVHCAKIRCCPGCEEHIRAMFACVHGATCGKDFVCGEKVFPVLPSAFRATIEANITTTFLKPISTSFSDGGRCRSR